MKHRIAGAVLALSVSFATDALAADQLGKVDFPNSCSPAVQEQLQRGVALLHSFYYSATQKADFSTDGRYRKITIEARKAGKGLQVRARKGYYAQPASSGDFDSAGSASNVLSALAPTN